MRKALNFDLDTKQYEKITHKKASVAYYEIKKFLKKNNFEHRQGSGYISKNSLNDFQISTIIQDMAIELEWLRKCVRQIDVTNVGKQHSLINIISNAPSKNDLSSIEL